MAVMRYVPDAVVLDVSIPGETGIEVLRKLKQFPKTSAIPTVVIAAAGEHLLAEKAKNLGADDFFSSRFPPTNCCKAWNGLREKRRPRRKRSRQRPVHGFSNPRCR